MSQAVSSFGTLLKMGDGGTTPAGGGGTSTVPLAILPGATSVTVASGTGFAIGDIVMIGTSPNHQLRELTGVAVNDLTWVDGLEFGYAAGAAVVEVAPETFTTIAEVHDITGPEQSVDMQEVTNHTSPGAFEELIATIKRSGDLTFDCAFVPSNPTHDGVTGLQKRYSDRARTNFKLVLPTGPAYQIAFTAFVQKLGLAAPVAGVLMRPVTLKVTGEPNLEAVA